MSDSDAVGLRSVPEGYALRESPPSVAAFRRLRREAGMAERSREAVARGLPNTTYGVHVVEEASGEPVGMARIVGDGGSVFHVSDTAVAEPHQGRGIGTAMMDALVAWLRANAPEGAYVNLLADVDGFYERWGFERSAPASKGMWVRAGDL
ncbi:GNAT family N-acetyltransferase [Halorubrum sp. CSM-61]|uniref:GNAT family N-acetyltransferase n=1 Tax=Halorubrum sp. CSM-61 TaxID=2485838 RepID=UPI000F4BFAF0|nr:GNAT family N-acetyltransferase [Halorubrum sp. CSM-61]